MRLFLRVIRFCHAIVVPPSHGRWILLCKLQNYNSALRELSLRPLTKLSQSVSLSLSLSRSVRFNFAFTGIRRGTERTNVVALTATLRRRRRLSLCPPPLEWVFISSIPQFRLHSRSSWTGVQLLCLGSSFSTPVKRKPNKIIPRVDTLMIRSEGRVVVKTTVKVVDEPLPSRGWPVVGLVFIWGARPLWAVRFPTLVTHNPRRQHLMTPPVRTEALSLSLSLPLPLPLSPCVYLCRSVV